MANQNGQLEVPYSFPPFVGHLIRLAPTDANSWRLFDARFIWNPTPELATNWTTQGTTHDLAGFQHLRDGYIAHVSTADISLVVNADGTNFTYTIPNSGGAYKKTYVVFKPMKAKLYSYTLTSASPFQLFLRDCEVHTRSWGDPGPYQIVNPFGDLHRYPFGAQI